MASMYWIWTDPNAIRRRSNALKFYMKSQEKIEKEIEKIEEKLKLIDWTDEKTELERIRLYQQLGKALEYYRMNRINVKFERRNLLKRVNITG